MNRPPRTPRQISSNDPRKLAGREGGPQAAPPKHGPSNRTAQLKALDPAPPAAAQLRGAAPAAGTIQANVVGGTRALHARLVALHASAHREAAARSADRAFNRPSAPNAAPTVQCKSSSGVEAFQVALQPKSGGQPLPTEVRSKMEAAFGADFSDVRVHVGHEASRIGAIAYTWGSNIHFAPGHYNPNTLQGQKVLGHELWHVVQQKSGRVKNPFGGGVAVVQDHALEAEADRMGEKAALTTVLRKADGGRFGSEGR
jgi:hypothetical protein